MNGRFCLSVLITCARLTGCANYAENGVRVGRHVVLAEAREVDLLVVAEELVNHLVDLVLGLHAVAVLQSKEG